MRQRNYAKTQACVRPALAVFAAMLILSCSTRDPFTHAEFRGNAPFATANYDFSEHELRTRKWRDPELGEMTMVRFETNNVPGNRTLALLQFGNAETSRAYYLEIYEYQRTPVSEPVTLRLLCRDRKRGYIAKVDVEPEPEGAVIRLVRVYKITSGSKTIRNWYAYDYKPKTGISETMSDFYSEIED
jgi:hypothetical protein